MLLLDSESLIVEWLLWIDSLFWRWGMWQICLWNSFTEFLLIGFWGHLNKEVIVFYLRSFQSSDRSRYFLFWSLHALLALLVRVVRIIACRSQIVIYLILSGLTLLVKMHLLSTYIKVVHISNYGSVTDVSFVIDRENLVLLELSRLLILVTIVNDRVSTINSWAIIWYELVKATFLKD